VGDENDATRLRQPAGGSLRTIASRTGSRRIDLVVLGLLSALLICLAASRRDFLGDGVRHLPAVLAPRPSFGEPRWLLFPPLAWIWVRLVSGFGLVIGPRVAIQALLWMCVASGIVFLSGIRSWLTIDAGDGRKRAAALLLAGSCAPVLILFSDFAEPQIAAAIVVVGLAHARRRRENPGRAQPAAVVAIAAIAVATLIYQGAILGLGMLPLVVSSKTLGRRRVAATIGVSVLAVFVVLIGAQIAAGSTPGLAFATAFRGERNPLTRSLMARPAPSKYLVAILAGPPQGVVALENYSGIPALLSALGSDDERVARPAILNALRLLLGCVVVGILVAAGAHAGSWRVLAALAVLLALPVLRNQQYGYAKFFILWPVPIALLAARCRTRTIAIAAAVVLTANTWLVAHEVLRGRELFAAVRDDYGRASPATCWFASGWSPPLSYLWPGTSVPVLGILATGDDPVAQATALTAALRKCFCESDAVWTDASTRDADMLASLARHFDYTSIDLKSVLSDPSRADSLLLPGAHVYSEPEQRRVCALTGGTFGRQQPRRSDRERTP